MLAWTRKQSGTVSVRKLHAKIGQLIIERDF
jgi:hypothetical protein